MVPFAELSIPAPQAFLGRGDASASDASEGIGRLRRGMGMRNPDGPRESQWASTTALKQRAKSECQRYLKQCSE